MTNEEYLNAHHEITESLIGLVSVQKDIESVNRILEEWKPKLTCISVQRCMTICEETGIINPEDAIRFLGYGK